MHACPHCGSRLLPVTDYDGRQQCYMCSDYDDSPTQCPECGCPRACLGHRESARRGFRGILVFCNCESVSEALV